MSYDQLLADKAALIVRIRYAGTIVGALILAVLTTLLTILQMPEGARRILFGLIILAVTAV